MQDSSFDAFFLAYIDCALWSTTDNADESGGEPLDSNYDETDLSPECRDEMRRDCACFVADNSKDLSDLEPEQSGHDFWLTRNGHGAGFWDRELGELGERLSKASKAYGSVYLYSHEGKVHCS